MTMKSKSLSAIALTGSLLAGIPALADSPNNGHPHYGRQGVVEETYSGSEGSETPPPMAPSETSKADEAPPMIQRERGNQNK